ncbi:ubiquinol oxidase subunit II [Bauldia sp.]|uniref:ubiquinol oxidase subunit II n=1 Tax=Bauldia sp. TaxID=2575872 RepID=UPI003BADBDC3
MQFRRVLPVLFVGAPALLLAGCTFENAPILDAAGPISQWERDILFRAFGIMMIVIIPVFVMTAVFAWRYRATSTKSRYDPDWDSAKVDAVTWIIPAIIVLAIAIHVWIFTHALDPYKPIESDNEPLEVQVVAQDWKWLFIYPDQDVASVNQLAFPSDTPLTLKITSDTVMNSFFIPALGSQIYAMAGMQTQLNLLSDEPGTFVGRNMQYSGDGFADQHFEAVAMTQADFDAWIAEVKGAAESLSDEAYDALAKPSIDHPVTHYSSVADGLYERIVLKYDCGMTCAAPAQ